MELLVRYVPTAVRLVLAPLPPVPHAWIQPIGTSPRIASVSLAITTQELSIVPFVHPPVSPAPMDLPVLPAMPLLTEYSMVLSVPVKQDFTNYIMLIRLVLACHAVLNV